MHTPYFWHQLHLHGKKISFFCVLLFLAGMAYGQSNRVRQEKQHLPDYDERTLTYGFTLGLHSAALRAQFSPTFNTARYDSVANIIPRNSVGFSIGFLGSFRIFEYLDLQFMPKVAFYDYVLRYHYTSGSQEPEDGFADFTVIDFPVMLKYKSQRRGNYRMFLIGGVTPTVDVTGKKQKNRNQEEGGLRLKGDNLALEAGVGTDIYFEFFKFSPQIRYSYGLSNVLNNQENEFGAAFDRLSTHSVALYLVFN